MQSMPAACATGSCRGCGRGVRAGLKGPAHRLCAAGIVTLGLLALLFLGAGASIHAYSFQQYEGTAQAAIVLGAAVWGERPSPVFRERIQHGIDLVHSGRVGALILTGGRGEGQSLAESEVARAYAMAQGVSAQRIHVETRSHITYENLREAKAIMEREGWTTALLVSDPLHMKRAVRMARDLGIEARPSPTPSSAYRTWHSKLGFLVRETFFYCAYWVLRHQANDCQFLFGCAILSANAVIRCLYNPDRHR